jgi:hypothetical protein
MSTASPTRCSTIGNGKKTNLSIGSSEMAGTTICSPLLAVQAVPTAPYSCIAVAVTSALQFTRGMKPNSILYI